MTSRPGSDIIVHPVVCPDLETDTAVQQHVSLRAAQIDLVHRVINKFQLRFYPLARRYFGTKVMDQKSWTRRYQRLLKRPLGDVAWELWGQLGLAEIQRKLARDDEASRQLRDRAWAMRIRWSLFGIARSSSVHEGNWYGWSIKLIEPYCRPTLLPGPDSVQTIRERPDLLVLTVNSKPSYESWSSNHRPVATRMLPVIHLENDGVLRYLAPIRLLPRCSSQTLAALVQAIGSSAGLAESLRSAEDEALVHLIRELPKLSDSSV